MTRLALRLVIAATITALLIVACRRPRPEIPARWTEPEDGYAPGELPLVDPRTNDLATYLRGWQGRQVTYTRVGREWVQ